MLEYGASAPLRQGSSQVEFVEADAASLDFAAQSFDAALSRWGESSFEPDGEAALARIRAFLKPGAKMAISSWGAPERVPMLSIPMKTAMERLDVPPPPPGKPGPLSRPSPEAISGLLEGGGYLRGGDRRDGADHGVGKR